MEDVDQNLSQDPKTIKTVDFKLVDDLDPSLEGGFKLIFENTFPMKV